MHAPWLTWCGHLFAARREALEAPWRCSPNVPNDRLLPKASSIKEPNESRRHLQLQITASGSLQ
eukprot:2655392-Pleurochrysis_carterae.AAC.4